MQVYIYLFSILAFALIALIAYFVMSGQNKILGNKVAIFTFVIVGIVLSLFGFIGYSYEASRSFLYFILLQVVSLGIGFGVSYFWQKQQVQTNSLIGSKSVGISILFFVCNLLLGIVGFTFLFNLFNSTGSAPYFSLCLIPFVIPHFVKLAYNAYLQIPNDIYKIWYYPTNYVDTNPDNINTKDALMLELEIAKTSNDAYTNTKLKAPVEMKFGDWFMAYIDYNNHKFEDDKINYRNEEGDMQGWMFFERPSFFSAAKYVDPDLTIKENRLKENKVIIAKRVDNVD